MRGLAQTQPGRFGVVIICSIAALLIAWTNTLLGLQIGSLIGTIGLLFMVRFSIHGCLQQRWSNAISLLASLALAIVYITGLFAILFLLIH